MNDMDMITEKKGMHCDLCNKKVDLLFGVLTALDGPDKPPGIEYTVHRNICSNCYLTEAQR